MRYLTFALAKGRLAEQSLDLLEKIGITCEEMRDKSSRKLIFTNEELGMRFFLAKASDVPTYVEYGAADIGVVGKDTILEEGRKLYEVMNLGLGNCRMCVCGPKEAKEPVSYTHLDVYKRQLSEIRLTIHEGKFHQVKRMFETLGCHVVYLKRLSMGTLTLDETCLLYTSRCV